jgi:hypothetical protein
MHVWRYSPQIFVRFLVAYIPSTQNLLDFSGHKKLFKLDWKIVGTVWNKEISDDENQNHRGG